MTTRPQRSSPAGSGRRVRTCARRAHPGIWRSISSTRTTSCTSIPTCRTKPSRARARPWQSLDRQPMPSIRRSGTRLCRQPEVSHLILREGRADRKFTRKCRTFWWERGPTKIVAGGSCGTITTTAFATAISKWFECWNRLSPTAWTRTRSSCSPPIMANLAAIIRCAGRATPPIVSRTICR